MMSPPEPLTCPFMRQAIPSPVCLGVMMDFFLVALHKLGFDEVLELPTYLPACLPTRLHTSLGYTLFS